MGEEQRRRVLYGGDRWVPSENEKRAEDELKRLREVGGEV